MAQLSGATSNVATTIADLNALGFVDWLKYATAGIITKSGGGSTITASSGGFDTSSSPIGRTIGWTGGTPTASGSDDNGRFDGSPDTFALPASTAVRTAVLYLGTSDFSANVVQFTITASLSDSSAGPYSFTTTGVNAPWNITLTYAAASAGQTLNITVTPTTSWAFFSAIGYSVAAAGLGSPSDYSPWSPRRPVANRRPADSLPLPRVGTPSWQTEAPLRAPRRRPQVEGVLALPAPPVLAALNWEPPPNDPRPPRPNRTQPENPLPLPAPPALPALPWAPDGQVYPRAQRRPPLASDPPPAASAQMAGWKPDDVPFRSPARRATPASVDVIAAMKTLWTPEQRTDVRRQLRRALEQAGLPIGAALPPSFVLTPPLQALIDEVQLTLGVDSVELTDLVDDLILSLSEQ